MRLPARRVFGNQDKKGSDRRCKQITILSARPCTAPDHKMSAPLVQVTLLHALNKSEPSTKKTASLKRPLALLNGGMPFRFQITARLSWSHIHASPGSKARISDFSYRYC